MLQQRQYNNYNNYYCMNVQYNYSTSEMSTVVVLVESEKDNREKLIFLNFNNRFQENE